MRPSIGLEPLSRDRGNGVLPLGRQYLLRWALIVT